MSQTIPQRSALLMPIAVILAILLFIGMYYIITYNRLVASKEHVNQSYAQVQIVTQRQADLIPSMVETVKGYAAHEHSTLVDVAGERVSAFKSTNTIDPNALANDPELQKKLIDAQIAMAASARSLITAVSESNPTLKADQTFINLQISLEESQNRIAVERRRNQEAVRDYNTLIQGFFSSMVAGNRYQQLPYYAGSDAAQEVPKIKF